MGLLCVSRNPSAVKKSSAGVFGTCARSSFSNRVLSFTAHPCHNPRLNRRVTVETCQEASRNRFYNFGASSKRALLERLPAHL